MSSPLSAVITTIAPPTESVRKLANALAGIRSPLIVVGDKKGPSGYDIDGALFLSLEKQLSSPYSLARMLPVGHYARKNAGYLAAIQSGAPCIYETDDDNAPVPVWAPRARKTDAQKAAPRPWFNVYRAYTDENIWPRGFPLRALGDPASHAHDLSTSLSPVDAPIQQGLVDGSPDVDAIWRLVLDRQFAFRSGPSVWLPPGTWCPFNSQSTWWWPETYPLLYLPSRCSFRMTDIWRSFVAQRCLWELGFGLVFHAPEMVQERNEHDLLRDFRDEVPGYLGNEEIARLLSGLPLGGGKGAVLDNLVLCYEGLQKGGFLPAEERELVRAWAADIESFA